MSALATPSPAAGRPLLSVEGLQVAFTQGGDWVAVVTADDRILIYDRLTARLRQSVELD